MLFNSYEFLLIFLPIALIGFHSLHSKSRRLALTWITACSMFFYAYWDFRYLALVLTSISLNFGLGLLIAQYRQRAWLVLGVALNLLVIAWFKYSLFLFLVITNHQMEAPDYLKSITLPLGISFFTFQQIAYLVNVWKGKEHPATLEMHAFIVLFFPHLIAGPIVLYENIAAQVRRNPRWSEYFSVCLRVGLTLFTIGLFKKVVIADSLAYFANEIFKFAAKPDYDLLFPDAILGTAAYTLQLYFDFSGYSDMAIGLGLMFGFWLPINFNSPYKATSIIDFWRRWHITLSSFFRNYIYVPLGGNRYGLPRQMLYIGIVFLLTGLWHGAGWTFIAWGGLHGTLVVINHRWSRTICAEKLKTSQHKPIRQTYAFVSWLLTMTSVAMLWVVFRADSWFVVKKFAGALLTFQFLGGHPFPDMNIYYVLPPTLLLLFVMCWKLPNSTELVRLVRMKVLRGRQSWTHVWPLMVGMTLYLAITSISHVKSDFLYFNF